MEAVILVALMTTVISTVVGWVMLKKEVSQKRVALVLGGIGVLTFILITSALSERGELRGACPLSDAGEVFLFIAWSLSLFFVFTGGAYRISLLGLFSTPAIGVFLILVLIPGMLTENPQRAEELDPWKESHAATSVLSYGALGLSALASVMFLILDKTLKRQSSGSFMMKMPPVSSLLSAVERLLILGVVILTLGIIAGFMSARDSGLVHLLIAGGVWIAYLILISWYKWKGMPPRRFAWFTVVLFLISCGIFFII